ncbi:tRNA pseudouridine32 synthase / 23S rRNA pseudouridine746 synthase [Chitinophaga skermanii]|uniref:tRNA pseudouridine32 synthase / 23S rRNA pseudouridine746 synthase n=1 Tax=Chitinophaga skermanii TaxID=331697 RepID=A0A327PZN5_9BACT|nr:pseudouridine synthase [Chitinophaga skermanii]RAI97690.1 tRNA pseudouridine32 synthase / 23S rRNA pseudouridine746 synthase [Chitinophaga skermanii]
MGNSNDHRISYFSEEAIQGISLPAKFTFPFYYEPHPLTKIAAAELQEYLVTHTGLAHDFGLDEKAGTGIGKMFGVLVIQDHAGKLGYLSAFSGKLAGTNDHVKFVPPVFDMLEEDSFFLKEQVVINSINSQIEAITNSEEYIQLQANLAQASTTSSQEIDTLKEELKHNKAHRKQLRESLITSLSQAEYTIAEAELIKQSLHDKHRLKVLTKTWATTLQALQTRVAAFQTTLETLKTERKEKSAALQQQLFDQYIFLNKAGKSKSVLDIFKLTPLGTPPSAAGECAIPKLLQYAFKNGYTPIAMAEFWWGASPKSEIRKHRHYYPACTGKCKPILAHMLEGMDVDDNPLLLNNATSHELDIVYEDESVIVVNKAAGLRSVPGVTIEDSVYSRLKSLMGGAEPYMVHRLDMDTSGLIVVAKSQAIHKHIQRQFLQRTVSKRYTALLSKVIETPSGEIDLPLCADLLNRPRQIVSFTAGKKSVTKWQVVERHAHTTKIHFWPLTGRTHQLRMHAAHELGLNAPIVGDDLYGTAAERMYLHAAYLEFTHPKSKEKMMFEVAESF